MNSSIEFSEPDAPIRRWIGQPHPFSVAGIFANRWPRIQGAAKVWWKFQQTKRVTFQLAKELLPEHAPAVEGYWNEYFDEVEKFVEVEKCFGPLSYYDFVAACNLHYNPLFYILTRCLKPELIVETGVASGISSIAWLEAMNKNGIGKLVSFDLPPSVETTDFKLCRDQSWKYRPPGTTSGWAVPDSLRDRWTLILGNSLEEMPKRLPELGLIDIFFHDSLHTYEHMAGEFTIVKSLVRQGGIVIADDAAYTKAFRELAEKLGLRFFTMEDDLQALRVI